MAGNELSCRGDYFAHCDGFQPQAFAGQGYPRMRAVPFIIGDSFEIDPISRSITEDTVVVGETLDFYIAARGTNPLSPNYAGGGTRMLATHEHRDVTITVVGSKTGKAVKLFIYPGGLDEQLRPYGRAIPFFGEAVIPMNESEALISVFDTTSEVVTLTLTDTFGTGFSVMSTQVVYNPGTLSQFVADMDFTKSDAGQNFTITFKAKDQYGNLVPSTNLNVDLKAEYVAVQRDYFGKSVDDFGVFPDYDIQLVSGNVLLETYGVIFIRNGVGQVTVTGTAAGRMQIDLLPFRDMDLALDEERLTLPRWKRIRFT
jgi:hypothetical protein